MSKVDLLSVVRWLSSWFVTLKKKTIFFYQHEIKKCVKRNSAIVQVTKAKMPQIIFLGLLLFYFSKLRKQKCMGFVLNNIYIIFIFEICIVVCKLLFS